MGATAVLLVDVIFFSRIFPSEASALSFWNDHERGGSSPKRFTMDDPPLRGLGPARSRTELSRSHIACIFGVSRWLSKGESWEKLASTIGVCNLCATIMAGEDDKKVDDDAASAQNPENVCRSSCTELKWLWRYSFSTEDWILKCNKRYIKVSFISNIFEAILTATKSHFELL